jgi:hypothetical protein
MEHENHLYCQKDYYREMGKWCEICQSIINGDPRCLEFQVEEDKLHLDIIGRSRRYHPNSFGDLESELKALHSYEEIKASHKTLIEGPTFNYLSESRSEEFQGSREKDNKWNKNNAGGGKNVFIIRCHVTCFACSICSEKMVGESNLNQARSANINNHEVGLPVEENSRSNNKNNNNNTRNWDYFTHVSVYDGSKNVEMECNRKWKFLGEERKLVCEWCEINQKQKQNFYKTKANVVLNSSKKVVKNVGVNVENLKKMFSFPQSNMKNTGEETKRKGVEWS